MVQHVRILDFFISTANDIVSAYYSAHNKLAHTVYML